jgi:alpha-methylacyl-CoA racemase|tara:strand:- start:21 stop:1124 length:1104 start_codon:yes stop_codon:yes gene_type:complete
MGPLKGLKILEFSGIGPGPFCGMVLADLGADVIRLDKASTHGNHNNADIHNRNKKSITVDLKNPESVNEIKKLVAQMDGLFEGFRPGVMERLGLGPDECLKLNKSLVYGRMTGWGQEGPMAKTSGHDINYIALSGVLDLLGRKNENPQAPLNLVGDFGGGGMLLAVGMLSAFIHSQRTGEGQIVDAAMIDGSSMLMSMFYSFNQMGFWDDKKESNLLDGGAHFYDTYECSDKKHIAIGSIEPQFYKELLEKLEIRDEEFNNQMNKSIWPKLKTKMAEVIKLKTRDEWASIFDGSEACVTPVLSLSETPSHEHHKARKTFMNPNGFSEPAPSPRFSKSTLENTSIIKASGEDNKDICDQYNLDLSKFT